MALAEHPLAVQLHNCRSVESITALLQDQLSTSSDFRGDDSVVQSLKGTMSILSTLSSTTTFDWAIGMPVVSQKMLMACPISLTFFLQEFSPENAIHAGLAVLFAVCAFLHFLRAQPCDVRVYQTAKGTESSSDTLVHWMR
jgi:hypothetical protein